MKRTQSRRKKRRFFGGEGIDHVTCQLCGRPFRGITYQHLKYVHGFDSSHPIHEYKERFRLRVACCQDTTALQSENMNERWDRSGRIWTKERIIRDLKALTWKGGTLRSSATVKRFKKLQWSARHLFGSWAEAFQAAGLEYKRRPAPPRWWTRKSVRQAIIERSRKGAALHANALVTSQNTGLYAAGCHVYGSWDQALRAAGLNPREIRRYRVWTPEKILKAIRKEARSGQPLHYQALEKRDVGLVDTARKMFGSWSAAVQAAGIHPDRANHPHKWPSAEEVRRMITRRAKRGEPLTSNEIDPSFYQAARQWFGSWPKAIEACGISYASIRRYPPWTRERIIAMILDFKARGVSLKSSHVAKRNDTLTRRARELFGSWKKAIEACGLSYKEIRQLRPWSKDWLRKEIRKRHNAKLPLNSVAIRKDNQSLYTGAHILHGSWPEALKHAGIPPESVCLTQTWTKEKVRTAILERHSAGKSLAWTKVLQEDSKLLSAAIKRHRTWLKALAACGIPKSSRSTIG